MAREITISNEASTKKPKNSPSYAKRPALITLKDHKENFKSNQKCHLINPSKSKMGIVSKKYPKNISKLISKLQYNQWRSTSTIIECRYKK